MGTTSIALDVRETGETGRGGRGTATWRRGDNYIALDVRETGETGRGGKRDNDMETWGQLQLLWM